MPFYDAQNPKPGVAVAPMIRDKAKGLSEAQQRGTRIMEPGILRWYPKVIPVSSGRGTAADASAAYRHCMGVVLKGPTKRRANKARKLATKPGVHKAASVPPGAVLERQRLAIQVAKRDEKLARTAERLYRAGCRMIRAGNLPALKRLYAEKAFTPEVGQRLAHFEATQR